MTTISFKDFSQGGNVSVVGNEGSVMKKEQEQGNSFMQGISRVADVYTKNLKEQALGGVENAQKTFIQGVDTMQQAQQMPLGTNAQKDKAILTGAAGAAQIGVGAMSGTIHTAFSPLTALIQTGVQGLQELDQVTGGNMKNQIAQVAQSNPELIKSISDYVVQNPKKVQFASDMLNILTAGLGGKAVGEAGKDLTKGLVTSTKEAVGNIPTPSVPGVITDTAAKVLPTSESIMQRVARIPKGEQAKFERITGESVGSYLDKRGIYGEPDKIVEQLYNRFQQSKTTADQALETIQGTYRATPVRTALKELEGKVQRTSSPGAPDPELARVAELVAKEQSTGLTMSEINEVKRIYERRVRLDYLKTNVPEDVARATNVDSALRNWQMTQAEKSGLTNLAEINKETQATKQLMDALGKEQAGIAGNNALGLTDAILVAGGSPESIASLVTKKIFSDKGVQSFVAKKMSKNPVKQGVPEAKFKEKLQLPSPSGTTKVQIEVPISLLSKSESAIEQELIKNFGKKYTKAEIYEMANRLKALPAPKEGQAKVQIEFPIKMTPTRDVDISKGFSKTSKTTTQPAQEKLPVSSPQSTPTSQKVKFNRGMINFGEWLPKLESDLSFATNAKSKEAKLAFTEDVATKLNDLGFNSGEVTPSTMESILNKANEFISQKKAELKNTPATKMVEDRVGTKKKVSSLEQEAKNTGIKYGGEYKGESKVVNLPSGGHLEFQNLDNTVVIRGVTNAGNVGKGEATKYIRELMQYAKDNNKDIVVSGVNNPSYWEHIGFKNIKDSKSILKNKDIPNKK